MIKSAKIKGFLFIYDQLWRTCLPFLRLNNRISEIYDQRSLIKYTLSKADLWIQAASAGESYLAVEIIKNLKPSRQTNALITTNTIQGMEILNSFLLSPASNRKNLNVKTAYFPFDKPDIINKAVNAIQPKCVVLLETEIWPCLLLTLKSHGCKILIVNGRLTKKSLKRYLVWPSFWQNLKPHKIFAVSKHDSKRFSTLFCSEKVDLMPNIKFDRLSTFGISKKNIRLDFLKKETPFLVLGSIREKEEKILLKIIKTIIEKNPNIVVGLFPRHMHRIKQWNKVLNELTINIILRSEIRGKVDPPTIILWDTFGELNLAYQWAHAAFVGGSLAPLGGQNFLEPLTAGVVPVIGPSWENFSWIGNEIFNKKLALKGNNWKEVADLLLGKLNAPPSRKKIRQQTLLYVKNRQGGTDYACRQIVSCL